MLLKLNSILFFTLLLTSCDESPVFNFEPPDNQIKSFSGHPTYFRDTTWVELNSNMTLEWNVPDPIEKNNNPWNYTVVTGLNDAIRYGWKSERFELRQGDCLLNDCYRPNKNERRLRSQDPNEIELETEYWYGWSFYVPSDNSAQDTFLFFGQVQQAPSANPLWMFIKNGKEPFCMLRTPTLDRSFYCEQPTDFPLIDHDNFAGKWHDMVMHVKFSRDDGFVNIWVDGSQKVSYIGNTITEGNDMVTFSYGLYRPTHKSSVVVYFDEVRWGTQREQVDIRIIETSR